MAETTVGSIKYDLDLDDSKFKGKLPAASGQAKTFGDTLRESAASLAVLGAAATVALNRITTAMGEAINAAMQQQSALTGLSSIARAFGQDVNGATSAAAQLASDGLMPLGDAATSLKNLLAAGFNLPQAITLLERFKDSAAFGRQGSLSFGEAIRGATEGIKNGNSILVDNAGVTKNLSMILEEAGYSAQDLMKASTDAGVRQAIFNGILKETNPMLGDASRLADSAAGAKARMETKVRLLKVALGEALLPALQKVFDILQPIIEKVTQWIKENPQLAGMIAIVITAVLALVAGLGLLGAAVGFIAQLAPLFAAIGAIISGVVGAPLLVIVGIIAAVVAVVMAMRQHWETIVNLFNQYLKPAFDLIWLALQQLWGSLKELWATLEPVLIPALKVLGVVLLIIIGIIIGSVIVAIWLLINVTTFLVEAFNWLARVIGAVVGAIWGAIQWWWHNTVNAFNSTIQWIQNLKNWFSSIVGHISSALSGVWDAITSPFRRAFDWVSGKVDEVVRKLKDLNPFQRHSPSLVDLITKGTNRIQDLYGNMFDNISQQAAQVRPTLLATAQPANQTNTNTLSTSIYGGVHVYNDQDEDRLIERISRNQELALAGIATRQMS